ncbi:uncharacterized protein BDZ83DRAFT_467831 [Colletotrichum acutatum]|uniref:Uncharacterized protein n=1 Tax=Glomerella acutata TaxID=27357 RepID=A0AAD8UBW5_GLOAC|nr:uncharacterized protein BDZ83DRAFT_467831 [Colletotrichum acutatum]KAK1718817.1 hypothetical protein BDZ83DRAFT_467831 [Colletotrichum acutatum]
MIPHPDSIICHQGIRTGWTSTDRTLQSTSVSVPDREPLSSHNDPARKSLLPTPFVAKKASQYVGKPSRTPDKPNAPWSDRPDPAMQTRRNPRHKSPPRHRTPASPFIVLVLLRPPTATTCTKRWSLSRLERDWCFEYAFSLAMVKET